MSSLGAPEPFSRLQPQPYHEYYVCDVYHWAPIEATPDDLVTGNCHDGWHLKTTEADYLSGGYGGGGWWLGGEFSGDYNGCGWIYLTFTNWVSDASYNVCGAHPSVNRQDYIYWDSTYGYWIWSDASGTDGLYAWMTKDGCPFYANYRPWAANQLPTGWLRSMGRYDRAPDGVNPRMKIRYLAKYPQQGWLYWVMARDTQAGTMAGGQGNWGFMPLLCFI